MIKTFFTNLLFLALTFSFTFSGHLLDDYKRKMGSDVNTLNSSTKQTVVHSYAMADEIKTFNAMRKKTFESSKEFINRVNKEISSRYNEINFYIKNASMNYSVGRVEMKRYNPDSQIMTLSLTWDKKIKDLLHQSNDFKTVTIPIHREEAKKLFSKKDKHFFHIQLSYTGHKLSISEIQLYNKYVLYRDINIKRISTVKNSSTPELNSEEEKQSTSRTAEVLPTKPNSKNEPNTQNEVLNKETNDSKDQGSYIGFWIILMFLMFIIIFFKYKSNVGKTDLDKKNISSTDSPSSKKTTSSVVTKKSKNVHSKKNIPIKMNYSKQLHDIALKYKINFTYRKIKISENMFTVEISQNKKVIARETAKTYNEAKQMAACVVLDKVKSVRKRKS